MPGDPGAKNGKGAQSDPNCVSRLLSRSEWKFKEQHAKNVGKYCGGEKYSRPRGFNIAGASAPSFRRLWANGWAKAVGTTSIQHRRQDSRCVSFMQSISCGLLLPMWRGLCVSVGHGREPYRNGWTNRDDVSDVDLGAPKDTSLP